MVKIGDGQWYTNKDLFEQINGIQTEFRDLRSEMRETRTMIRQYNGLREIVDDVKQHNIEIERKVDDIEARAEGRSSVGKAIREWGGWIIAIISLIILFL